MKLYTSGGDGGDTSLFDGTRVPKDHPRVAAYGDVDELNSALGWCRCAAAGGRLDQPLEAVQRELFIIGAELATPPDGRAAQHAPQLDHQATLRLEGQLDDIARTVPPLQHFVLPGGAELAARLHLARTVCRRAERAVVSLAGHDQINPEIVVYLNRLGDLLFAWARLANQSAGAPDVLWVSKT